MLQAQTDIPMLVTEHVGLIQLCAHPETGLLWAAF